MSPGGCARCRLYLNDQHVDHTGVVDVPVPVEHLPHFVSSLTYCDVQLKHSNCGETNIHRFKHLTL